MNPLHRLRNSPWLVRLALLWFAMTLGVAVASPMVSGDHQVMVCSAGGMVKIVLHDDGSTSTAPAGLDCPLCALGGAPAPAMSNVVTSPSPVSHVRQSTPAVRIAAPTSAPPPARAPPTA